MGLNQFHPPESCSIQEQFGWNVGIYFKNISDKGALSETIMSARKFDSKILPDFNTPMLVTPEQRQGNYFNRQIRSSYRYVFLHSHTFPLYQFKGDHIIKAGSEINYTSYSGTNESYPVFVLREDGSLSRQITFTGSTHIGQHITELTLFAQDSWSINKKLTVDLCIRLDKNYLISGYYIQPRIAFVYTSFERKTTIIQGGIGTFYDKFLLNVPDFLKSQTQTEQYYSENGESYSLRYVPLIKNDLKLPRSIICNTEIDQQLVKNLVLRVNYMYRKGSDELIVNPEIVSSQEAYLILSNNGHSLYRALETTLRYDFKNNFVVFSYIRSKAEGNLNSFSQIYGYLQEPIIRKDCYSLLPTDQPNRLLFWGIFRLPKGITFSPLLEYHTGFPYSAVDENQNYTGEINGHRFRDFVQLDIRLTKSIKYKKYTFQAGLKILNVLNHFNPHDVNNNIDSPYFGYSCNQVRRRTFRIVFEILY